MCGHLLCVARQSRAFRGGGGSVGFAMACWSVLALPMHCTRHVSSGRLDEPGRAHEIAKSVPILTRHPATWWRVSAHNQPVDTSGGIASRSCAGWRSSVQPRPGSAPKLGPGLCPVRRLFSGADMGPPLCCTPCCANWKTPAKAMPLTLSTYLRLVTPSRRPPPRMTRPAARAPTCGRLPGHGNHHRMRTAFSVIHTPPVFGRKCGSLVGATLASFCRSAPTRQGRFVCLCCQYL
jgi:hypothetical protein